MAISGELRKMLEENLETFKAFKAELENRLLHNLNSLSAPNATGFQKHRARKAAGRRGPIF
jgi:hypothetical protein